MPGSRQAHALRGVALASSMLLGLAACGAPGAQQQEEASDVTPEKPSEPIAVTVLDGAGNLVGSQPMFDSFVEEHPDLVSDISYESAAAPDVMGKIRAQQTAGEVTTTIVIGGPDVLGAAQSQDALLELYPAHADSLPDLDDVQDEPRALLQELSDGEGVVNRFDYSGPMLASDPETVTDVPDTPEALLEWAEAHPGKFAYAQPDNSGPGRGFVQTLPYLLGDSDPSDPVDGWDKTWAYLDELNQHVSSYPASSTIMNQQFGAGQLELVPTIVSMDINNRRDGGWSPDTAVTLFADQHWIEDGHFMMVPKGVSPEALYVALAMISDQLTPEQQVKAYDSGALNTANASTSLDQASEQAQADYQQWGRPDFYPAAFSEGTVEPPLAPADLTEMFELWQERIGSNVGG
ncbi:extracellular solute-binding protein [uncultured Pseudokineococcus sp.]|uniref:extracellular solute-binding protein n=1 Tax=uncultured Pseudokineococcus sp. TaxID=1642928 RepID=UPI002608F3A6|nr:extracellular solute-binding protein [uncultured Pseudokineococcus sp.]